MKIQYYPVKFFGYDLYLLLCCFRLSCSLTVEGGMNVFTYITRVKPVKSEMQAVAKALLILKSLDFCLFLL